MFMILEVYLIYDFKKNVRNFCSGIKIDSLSTNFRKLRIPFNSRFKIRMVNLQSVYETKKDYVIRNIYIYICKKHYNKKYNESARRNVD